jgi:hypothetical protein
VLSFKSPWKCRWTSLLLANIDLPQVEFVLTRARALSNSEPKEAPRIKVGGSVDITGRVERLIITRRIDIGVEILSGVANTIVFNNIDHQRDWI